MVPYFHLIQLHWVGCHPWNVRCHPWSTMPPWYALPVLHVGFSSICWYLFWSNWSHKFHSIYPQSITLHPARLTPQPRISIASTGLKYQNLMEYDFMRDSSKRWKNQDFPHIPYYHIPEDFYLRKGKQKNLFRIIFSSNMVTCRMWKFFWYTIPFVEYDDLWVGVWSAMGSSGVRWHPSSAMPHEYARPEILWEKDSGPQFPKFNRADAGCCNLTEFQSTQQTSQAMFWNPLLLQSPKWETHLSGHALAHPGCIAIQEQHKASTWCQTISKLNWAERSSHRNQSIHRCETCHTQGNRLGKQWVQRDRSGVRWIHGICKFSEFG